MQIYFILDKANIGGELRYICKGTNEICSTPLRSPQFLAVLARSFSMNGCDASKNWKKWQEKLQKQWMNKDMFVLFAFWAYLYYLLLG